jgi:hypothetical protein
MDSSGFGMDEVYRSNVEIRTNTNEEETLQFGDFGSVIVQSAREVADLSLNYVDEGSVRSSDLSYDKSEADDSQKLASDDKPEAEFEERLFTMDEVMRIVHFSQRILKRKEVVPPVSLKQEHLVPVVAINTIKLEPNLLASPSPLLQSSTAAGVSIRKVQKKDYCTVTSDNFKLFRDIKFTIVSSGKNNYEKLNQLHTILGNMGLLTLINGQRGVPEITDSNPLGFHDSYVIYRPKSGMQDMSRNLFEDDKGPYLPGTCTAVIALREDDIVCYQNDLGCLKSVCEVLFDNQLRLYALTLITENRIIEAFHLLINKIRGRRQEDIEIARDNLNQFKGFDMSVDIHVGINSLVKLFSALQFTTGVPIPESELMRKLSQCVFRDDRHVLHNTLLDSMARGHTYQESVDTIYRVMDMLPVDKQSIGTHQSINAMTTGKSVNGGYVKKLYCFPYQLGNCSSKECKYLHEKDAKAAERAKGLKSRDDRGGKSGDGRLRDKKFNVNLSVADRQFFGTPRGKPTSGNPDGWSERQRHSINAVIASDHSRVRGSSPYQPDSGPVYDQSPDQLFDQYVNACHQQTVSTPGPRSRVHTSSAQPEFSHYINSFRVIPTGDIEYNDPSSSCA